MTVGNGVDGSCYANAIAVDDDDELMNDQTNIPIMVEATIISSESSSIISSTESNTASTVADHASDGDTRPCMSPSYSNTTNTTNIVTAGTGAAPSMGQALLEIGAMYLFRKAFPDTPK